MINKQYENELLRQIDHLQKQVNKYEGIVVGLNARIKLHKKAFELACNSLREHCYNSESCIYDCPLYTSECCQSGVPALVDWEEYFLKKAGKAND